jgi:hypothetical protein
MRRCATWSPGPPSVRKTTAGRARRSISGCAGTSMESWMCGSAPVDHGQRCSGRIRGAGPRIAPSVKVWGGRPFGRREFVADVEQKFGRTWKFESDGDKLAKSA